MLNLPYNVIPQLIATLIITGGAFSTGLSIGWSALNDVEIQSEDFKVPPVTDEEFSWIGSSMTLAAAFVSIPIGIIMNSIGRKPTMILVMFLSLFGYLLLIFVQNLPMIYAGRVVVGLSSGAACVVSPTYIGEISAKEIRGGLGSFFQLLITFGILVAYILGWKLSLIGQNTICAIVSAVFIFLLLFLPESPTYYLWRGKKEKALKSYAWLRGKNYDASGEMESVQTEINALKSNPIPFHKAMTRKSSYKSLLISIGLMVFQQISGINVYVYYTGYIFTTAGSTMDTGLQTTIVGLVMFLMTFVSIGVLDLVGRIIMLIISALVMILSSVVLGFYFYIKHTYGDKAVSTFDWLPIVCLSLYFIAFSIGCGPIPWVMAGELFATDVRSTCAAITSVTNWTMTFIVIKTFVNFILLMGPHGVFWMYSGLTALGLIFIILIVPETKNKTLAEITDELARTGVFKDFKAQYAKS